MKRYELVTQNKEQFNQVGANGITLNGFIKPERFNVMQDRAMYWRSHGVKTYIKIHNETSTDI